MDICFLFFIDFNVWKNKWICWFHLFNTDCCSCVVDELVTSEACHSLCSSLCQPTSSPSNSSTEMVSVSVNNVAPQTLSLVTTINLKYLVLTQIILRESTKEPNDLWLASFQQKENFTNAKWAFNTFINLNT